MKRIPGPSTEPNDSMECTLASGLPSARSMFSVSYSIVGICSAMMSL
ncbi:hypothetical protein [Prevotella pallens]